jgi:hypothetical protein
MLPRTTSAGPQARVFDRWVRASHSPKLESTFCDGRPLAMRLLALIAHRTVHFDWSATLGIFLIGGILGANGGLHSP